AELQDRERREVELEAPLPGLVDHEDHEGPERHVHRDDDLQEVEAARRPEERPRIPEEEDRREDDRGDDRARREVDQRGADPGGCDVHGAVLYRDPFSRATRAIKSWAPAPVTFTERISPGCAPPAPATRTTPSISGASAALRAMAAVPLT